MTGRKEVGMSYNDGYNEDDSQYSEYGTYSENVYSSVNREIVANNVIAKSFMYMVIAMVVTAVSAYVTLITPPLFNAMINNVMIFIIAEIATAFLATLAIRKNLALLAGALFSAYCIMNGITLSVIFFVYELGSIQNIFILCAVVFAVMSIYGFTTKRKLTSIGSICIMALLGMIIVSIFNIFIFNSAGIEVLMNYIGVLIFVGLTAYDVQRLKNNSLGINAKTENSTSVYFAMTLYLDFINLFLRLLAISGKGRN